MATKQELEKLAKAGIHVEIPSILVRDDAVASIDTIAQDTDLSQVAAEEAFMAQKVKIRLATTTDENAPPYATVTVNHPGNRSQIPRGVAIWVPRSHVEVLARMRETKYRQPQRDMMNPEAGNELFGRSAMVYPFEMIEDPHPLGRAWLERILADEGN